MSQTSEGVPSPTVETKPRSRNLKRTLLWMAIGLVVLLLVVWLGVGTFAALTLTEAEGPFNPANNPAAYGLTYEDIRFPARDGQAEIAAWYIPSAENERAVVLVHGRNASRTDAFLERFPELAAALNEAGFSVLMIDLRGHGESSDGRFSFGIKERYDVLGAVDWLKERGFEPGRIGVLGVSLGAAASVGATADEPAVGALVTDSSFAEILPIIKALWVEESGLPMIFLYSTMIMNRVLFGYHLPDAKPVEEIGSIAPRRVMLIHCQTDEEIPVSHMQQLEAAEPAAETWLIPVCDHAEGYVVVKEEYDQRVSDFFDKNLR